MIQYETSNRLADALLTKSMLDGLEHYYPDFGFWYVNKCMPGIITGKDLLLVAREHGQIVGVALGKKDVHETKLRCVRVIPEYQKRGIGLHLVERSLRALDDDKPHVTVAEELIHEYSRPFINYFGFDLSEVDKGRYRRGKLEYVFNAPPAGAGKIITPL